MDPLLQNTEYDWQYTVENDNVTHQALKNGTIPFPRAKMLGGCSSINAMFYVRGRDADFKSWADEGNPSWTPKNVNLYFKKAENFRDMNLIQNADIQNFYGHSGLLGINTFNSTYRKITEKVLKSWEYIGFKNVKDINSAIFKGHGISGIMRATAGNGKRRSVYASYIEPAKLRNNLKILTGAFVTKILLNEKNEAIGVEVTINGESKTFYANKEVIVSGGTVNSPQLLMLSGIGPREHLLSKNISCKINLSNVGQNLQDHSYIPIPIYGDKPGVENPKAYQFEVIKYMYNKSGLLAQNSLSDITAFYSRDTKMTYPEFQNHLTIIWKNSSTVKLHVPGYKDETYNSYLKYIKQKALYLFAFHLLHPFSKGAIYLRSQNPYDKPLIKYSYFEDERDVKASVEGIKKLVKIVNAPYFKSINAFVHRVNIPQCNNFKFQSSEFWKCFLINVGVTVYHPVGTCKMGPSSETAVVDNFLKVHGAKKLRIIDASIMPSPTSGNTQAPSIMIGEMGADMIKQEYLGCSKENVETDNSHN